MVESSQQPLSKKALKREQKKIAKLAKLKRPELPYAVAQNSALPDFLDGSNYQLIFAKYNHKLCEMAQLNSVEMKTLINKFSSITNYNKSNIGESKLIRRNITKAFNYTPLFEGLEDDVELKEIKFRDDGRIFFYFVNNHPHGEVFSNYCCIVAVKKKHTVIK